MSEKRKKKKDYSFDASRNVWANHGFRGYKGDLLKIHNKTKALKTQIKEDEY